MMESAPTMNKKSCIFIAVSVVFLSLVIPRYLDLVTAFGHGINDADIATDYLKGCLWAIILGVSILFWPVSIADKKCLLLAWGAKCFLTLVLMLFYESYYGLDAYMYFDESRTAAFDFSKFTFQSGTINVVNLSRLHRQFLPDSYHAMKVTYSMVGLLGIYLYYRAGVRYLQREQSKLFYALALFPGVFFWSSILGKDPIVFFGIALYVYGVIGWYKTGSLRFVLAVALGVLTAVLIRQWLGFIMLLPLAVFLVRGVKGIAPRVFLLLFVVILMYFSVNTVMERWKLASIQDAIDVVEISNNNLGKTEIGSARQLNLNFSSVGSIIAFLPFTAFTALFRPLPGEVMNPFGLLAGLESSYLIYLLGCSIRRTRWSELKDPLVLWAILLLVVWAVVNGVVSSANLGLAVRYRLQVLCVLLGLLLHLSRDRERKPNGKNRSLARLGGRKRNGEPPGAVGKYMSDKIRRGHV